MRGKSVILGLNRTVLLSDSLPEGGLDQRCENGSKVALSDDCEPEGDTWTQDQAQAAAITSCT